MLLQSGTRLGPYEVQSPLGAGGMGEVYKARDTRLDRAVAIKILPDELAADSERRARFEREARMVASLNHPHICAIHDVGSAPSSDPERPIAYLVMELVDGETLAARIARGPLPLDQVARFAAEIALALDAAHRQRVAHRDLKPTNVMVTRSGVKLLDFGLAKAVAPEVEAADVTASLDLTAMTAPGTVLGTLPYMAPEQVEGRAADARSDIFALGAVMYEMATGRRAFTGESPAAMASAILASQPPALEASPALDRIIRGCLAKDPDRRWQSAHDVAMQLAALADHDRPVAARRDSRWWLPWAVAAAATVLAIGAAARGGGTSPAATALSMPLVFPVAPPAGGTFTVGVEWVAFAVSPDGSHLAYAARPGDSRGSSLWVRPLSSLDARPIPGTEGATSVFWSPDGRSVGFFADDKLKRVALAGGAPVHICSVRQGIGHSGTWGADGSILFASVQGEAIMRVPASSGTPVEVLKPDPARNERRTTWPSFLPDGRSFLYGAGFSDEDGAIMLVRGDGTLQEIVRVKSAAQYVDPGYLVFAQDSTLVARHFDAATGAISGDPIAIADRVNFFLSTGAAQFSASRAGVMAYLAQRNESHIVSFDRSGRELAEVRPRGDYLSLRVTGDGSELLFDRADPRSTTYDIWRFELDRGVETPLTSGPGANVGAQLDADGRMIYSAARGQAPRLYRRDLASGADEPLESRYPGMQTALDLAPDGQWIVYSQRSAGGNFDLHAFSLADRTVIPLRDSPANEFGGRFSPDGRWIAYTSDATGQPEVYVVGFPTPGAPRAVSAGGGRLPRWSPNGRELLYAGLAGQIMSVSVRAGSPLEIGRPSVLFPSPTRFPWADFDITPDGRLMAVVPLQYAAEQPLTMIVDWPALAKSRQ
ncbi:hypothetical protein BH24ACI4_BH24ACI4_27800 [soil metagenome]